MSSLLQRIGKLVGSNTTAQVSATGGGSARSVARERLSVILASQRGSELLQGVDMKALQQDVLEVVKKHIDIANGPVQFQLNSEGQVSLFEMSVELEARTRVPGGPIHEEVA